MLERFPETPSTPPLPWELEIAAISADLSWADRPAWLGYSQLHRQPGKLKAQQRAGPNRRQPGGSATGPLLPCALFNHKPQLRSRPIRSPVASTWQGFAFRRLSRRFYPCSAPETLKARVKLVSGCVFQFAPAAPPKDPTRERASWR